MGIVRSTMMVCTSYSLSSKNNVLAIDDMEHDWYFNLEEVHGFSIFRRHAFSEALVDDAQLS